MNTLATTPLKSNISQLDRMGLTLFIALTIHAILILGVSFDLEDLTNPESRAKLAEAANMPPGDFGRAFAPAVGLTSEEAAA